MGIDGNGASVRYARRTVKGSFCVGDVRHLRGVADETFDVAFTVGTLSLLRSEDELCAAARELGRVLKKLPPPSGVTTSDTITDSTLPPPRHHLAPAVPPAPAPSYASSLV